MRLTKEDLETILALCDLGVMDVPDPYENYGVESVYHEEKKRWNETLSNKLVKRLNELREGE